jgi:hypothetical protein
MLSDRTKFTVPEVRMVEGMDAGTAVVRFPSGMVAVAETVAKGLPARPTTQLLMVIVSGAPTLSVIVTVAGGLAKQSNPAKPAVTPL